ncbi:MAG: hypothetical protein HC822_03760 [Oscillochloris sp.]|nr:hypothetical protein [Oscillochloris sp.]
MHPSLYLIIQFDFPTPFQQEHGRKARALHDLLVEQDWIQEVLAASGGIGPGPSAIWVFKLANYAALDRLLHSDDPLSKVYKEFFDTMTSVTDIIREEVQFL